MRTLDPRTRTRALAAFLVAALRRAAADELPNVAKAVAFGIFFAIPSAMLVALGLFGLVASPGGIARTVDRLHGVIPASVIGLVQADLTRVAASRSGSIGLFVGGLALALWSLTGAMTTLMWGLNAAHELSESRGFVRRRLDALALVGCSMAAFVLVFAVLVLGPYTAHWVGDAAGRATLVESLWRFAEWPLAALPLLVIFAAILSIGPDLGRGRLRAALPGAAWTTVAWLVVSTLFGVYAANYGRYDRSWGSLGAVIVALTWIWLSSLAVLIGAEVNAEIVRRRAAGRECTRGSTNPDGRHGESRGGGAPPVECPAMGSREAACSCGQLRLEATGDPTRISMCHCLACQRRTGSAFGIQAAFASDQVHVVGRYSDYTRISDAADRRHHVFHFCPDCGGTVFLTEPAEPDRIVVAVGAFADPSFPSPTVSVYGSRRHPWFTLPATIEQDDELWEPLRLLYEAGAYAEAADRGRAVIEARPDDAGLLYNVACCESLAGRPDDAIAHLRAAFERDGQIRSFAARDSDLDPIRDRPGFGELFG